MAGEMQVFMGGAQMPAHVAAAFAEESNIKDKVSIPTMSISGKKFSMKIGGEINILTKIDPETGEKMNMSFINVVVLDQNPNRSRTYFAKEYVSGENQMPECYSTDGKTPDKDVKTPAAATCASCPNSVKGSKIRNGKEGYACESKKRLAIWPAAMLQKDMGLPPMQLILPITSIWDKENKQNDAEGWFAWDNYLENLRNMGVTHTAQIVTRIKFDNTEHPKVLFKAVRWLDDGEHIQFGEIAKVKNIIGSEDVRKLLYGKLYDEDHPPVEAAKPAAPKQSEDDDGFSQVAAQTADNSAVEAAKKAAAEQAAAEDKAAKKAAADAKKAAEKAAEKAAAVAAAEASKPAPAVAEVTTATPGLAALAAEWGDD
ncbi:MAG: hypothetical protein ACYC36_02640 [Bellilinea sp.]